MIEKKSGLVNPFVAAIAATLPGLYGPVSGAIRLCYKLKLKRAGVPPYRLSWLVISPQAATEKPRSLSGWWNSCNSAVFAWGSYRGGYGGKAESYPLLLSADTTTAQAGDEPVLIYQRTDAPVAVSPVRSDAIKPFWRNTLMCRSS